MCWPVGSLRYHPTTTPCSGGSIRCAAASVSPTSCSVAPSAITCCTRTTPCATTYEIPVSGAWSTRPTRYPSRGRWRPPSKWSSTAASVRCAMKIRLVSPSGGASSWMAGRHRTDCAVGGGCAGNSLIMLPRCTGPARNTRRGLRPPLPRAKIPAMTRSPVLLAASVALLCLLPAPRSLGPSGTPLGLPVVVEYPLPRPKAFPHDPAVGADGIVWYTDQANSYIGRLDPATGKVTDYATPTLVSGPHGIVVAPPPDGGVWYTANFKGRLGRLDPATGAIKEYPLPAAATDPHTPLYHAGKVWFTAQGANLYGELDPATGEAKLFPVPTPRAHPYGLVASPRDGSIWMALFGTNQIGRIDPADGSLKIFPLPAANARPRRLIVDAQGIVWYSDYARGHLGRLDPATGQVRDIACPGGDGSQPYGIAIGTDGRIWYDESGTDELVAFDPTTERAETVKIPTPGSVVRNMAVDSTRRRLWLALSGVQKLGRIDLK